MTETTTIEVRTETWSALNARKDPGQTFDEVIRNTLEAADE